MIRISKVSIRCFLATLICSQLIGCAQLQKPPLQRTDATVVRSYKEKRTSNGDFITTDLNLQNDRILANISREKLCYTVDLNEVRNQKIETYKSEYVGSTILAGLAFSAVGGGLIAASPDFSSERPINEKGEEELSNRSLAIIFGVMGSIFGVGTVVKGISVYTKSGDQPY